MPEVFNELLASDEIDGIDQCSLNAIRDANPLDAAAFCFRVISFFRSGCGLSWVKIEPRCHYMVLRTYWISPSLIDYQIRSVEIGRFCVPDHLLVADSNASRGRNKDIYLDKIKLDKFEIPTHKQFLEASAAVLMKCGEYILREEFFRYAPPIIGPEKQDVLEELFKQLPPEVRRHTGRTKRKRGRPRLLDCQTWDKLKAEAQS